MTENIWVKIGYSNYNWFESNFLFKLKNLKWISQYYLKDCHDITNSFQPGSKHILKENNNLYLGYSFYLYAFWRSALMSSLI